MKRILFALILAAAPLPILGAIGCTLSNPAEDLKYLYPDMTTFKEELKEFPKMKDGAALFKGQSKIGVVHGVNVPGKGGVIQVFLATDPTTAEIKRFFFQRLESPAARQLRAREFLSQFAGLTLADFYKHDYYAAADPGSKADKVAAIKPPALDAAGKPDYLAAVRGVRKNLVLLDYFIYGRRFEPFFERAQKAK